MAYRFLLEVPENLAAEAYVAVASAGDAQVLVDRAAHGLGIDVPYHDLTVAAHSLRVVYALYDWANEIGAIRPESRSHVGIVLHSGRRIGLHQVDAPTLVAAIRHDQPWVEHTIPMIGDHESEAVAGLNTNLGEPGASPAVGSVATIEQAPPSPILAVNLVDAEDEVTIRGRTYAVIQVLEIEQGESFYTEMFGLTLDGRMRRDGDGNWVDIDPGDDHGYAPYTTSQADVSFLHNGPLHVALRRAGRAARLEYALVSNRIAVAMEPSAAAGLKAKVLMRGHTLLASEGQSFTFRDPYGVAWSIQPHAA